MHYGNVGDGAIEAFKAYIVDVWSDVFPNQGHSYQMSAKEAPKLEEAGKSS